MQSPNPTRPLYPHAHLYFLLAMVVTAVGFSQSYFARLSANDGWHHFHGITVSAWMLLLVVQPLLYKHGQLALHRKLGKLSFLLVPLIVLGGLQMVQAMLHNPQFYPPRLPYQLAFLDFFGIAQFLLFFTLAIVQVKQVQYHARYIAATVLIVLPPAITRLLFLLPGINSFKVSLNLSYALVELVILWLLWDDQRTGRIRLPYLLLLASFAVLHGLFNFVLGWNWWPALMDSYASLHF